MPPSEPNGIPVLWPAEEEVTHVRKSDRPPAPPEVLYRDAAPAARASIRAAVVEAYAGHVARLVRKLCPYPGQRCDAEQAGAVGILLALDRFDPTRGAPFWAYASQWVKDEVKKAVYGNRPYRSPNAQQREAKTLLVALLAASTEYACADDDVSARYQPSVEDLVGDHEAMQRLETFLATLPVEDRHLLLCERRKTDAAGNNARGRCQKALVTRARAHVLGSDSDDESSDEDEGEAR